jgi:hypothetical protein
MDEDRSIVLAASATGMSQSQPGDHQADANTESTLSAEIANSVDQSFGTVNGDVAQIDSLDVCDRCRDTPWLGGPLDKTTIAYALKAACPICNFVFGPKSKAWNIESSLTWNVGTEVSSIFRPRLKHATGSRILLRQSNLTERYEDADYLIWTSDLYEGVTGSDYQYCDSPKISFSQIREHIDVCMKHHESCSLEYYRPLVDLRVIDCKHRLLVDAPTDCRYIALSYVWGEVSSPEDYVLSHSLPPTIEHSIITTLRLGFRYLWIDRYVSLFFILYSVPTPLYCANLH